MKQETKWAACAALLMAAIALPAPLQAQEEDFDEGVCDPFVLVLEGICVPPEEGLASALDETPNGDDPAPSEYPAPDSLPDAWKIPTAMDTFESHPMARYAHNRAVFNVLSDTACEHDTDDWDILLNYADAGYASARTAVAWAIATERCAQYSGEDLTATRLYGDAARQGYPLAMGIYGIRLIRGIGTPLDRERGISYVLAAADGGYTETTITLADLFVEGVYFVRDLGIARNLLTQYAPLQDDSTYADAVWERLLEAEAAQ